MTSRSIRMRSLGLLAIATLSTAAMAMPAQALPTSDPANDFIPSFTGVKNGDLDVLSVAAVFDGSFFHLSALLNGTIGTTAAGLYVFGFNRGQGTARFGSIATGVLFDAVVAVTAAGTATLTTLLPAPAATPLPSSDVRIAGANLFVDVPVSLLPSLGLAPSQYGINLWPRDSSVTGNAAISDFAPDNATFVADLPEPGSVALLAAGFGLFAALRRRRPKV